jgi:hypothetical protein
MNIGTLAVPFFGDLSFCGIFCRVVAQNAVVTHQGFHPEKLHWCWECWYYRDPPHDQVVKRENGFFIQSPGGRFLCAEEERDVVFEVEFVTPTSLQRI